MASAVYCRSRALAIMLLAGVLLSHAACSRLTGPSSALAGNWRTVPIPSGSGIELSLSTMGSAVAGTGHEYQLMHLADDLTVSGREDPGGVFQLTISRGSGTTASYVGRLTGDQLDGTWADFGQQPHALSFYRQQSQ